MGSDMSMAANSFQPRPNKAEWDGDNLVILTDRFMNGYEVLWRGPVTPDNESLVKVMVKEIPPKPEPLPTRADLLYAINDGVSEYMSFEEAAEVAVDITRHFLVHLLVGAGYDDAADLVDNALEE